MATEILAEQLLTEPSENIFFQSVRKPLITTYLHTYSTRTLQDGRPPGRRFYARIFRNCRHLLFVHAVLFLVLHDLHLLHSLRGIAPDRPVRDLDQNVGLLARLRVHQSSTPVDPVGQLVLLGSGVDVHRAVLVDLLLDQHLGQLGHHPLLDPSPYWPCTIHLLNQNVQH